ncbi:hypothetical protein CRYUN_Cryun40dG0056200 [Craigia yunnanensis]
MGHGLEELFSQLSANDRRSPPPASRSSIDSMPTIKTTRRQLHSDSHDPVCKDKLNWGLKKDKCHVTKYIYCSDCIIPWLVQHNSCPLCRQELPPQGTGSSRSYHSSGQSRNSSFGTNSNRREVNSVASSRRILHCFFVSRAFSMFTVIFDHRMVHIKVPLYNRHHKFYYGIFVCEF